MTNPQSDMPLDAPAVEQPTAKLADVVADQAIAHAKDAAAKAGVDTSEMGVLVSGNQRGTTSYSFQLEGLENAVQIAEIEQALAAIENGVVQAKIIFDTSMAWISASPEIHATQLVEVFAQFGITATLTDTSLQRRMAWADVEEGRRFRAERRAKRRRAHARLNPGKRVKDGYSTAVEASAGRMPNSSAMTTSVARLSNTTGTVVHRPAPVYSRTSVLYTARELVTRRRLIVSLIFSIPVLCISFTPALQFDYWQWVLMLLSAPVVCYGAWPFHRATIAGARRGLPALDAATSVAIMSAWCWTVAMMVFTSMGDREFRANPLWTTIDPTSFADGVLFFDVACGMTVILLAGRLVVRKTRPSFIDQLRLFRPDPKQQIEVARKQRRGGTTTQQMRVQQLKVGDDILVAPGALIPVDGHVIGGASLVDASLIGIAPYAVKVNSRVFAGSINRGPEIKVRVDNTGHRTWIAAIATWVSSATMHLFHAEDISTRTASSLVPLSFMVAAANFGLWALLTNNLNQAFATSLAVLGAVAPVAAATSTSIAVRQGIEGAARKGALIRDGRVVQDINEVEAVIFNRVGALSGGEMHVETITAAKGEDPELVIRVAAALSMDSDHPVGKALVRAARESRDSTTNPDIPNWIEAHHVEIDADGNFHASIELPMINREGRKDTRTVEAMLWRPKNLSELSGRLAAAAVAGGTPLVVRWKGIDRGVITLHDDPKADALEAVDALESQGIETLMLSRDTYPVARRYGDSVGVSGVLAGIQPRNKAQTVRSVRAHGLQVAMVGDSSVNHCFQVANVGVLLGAMRDVNALNELEHPAADVVMLQDDVMPVSRLFHFARRLRRLIRHNNAIVWLYHAAVMVLAVSGILHPMLATVAMLGISLLIEWRSARARVLF